MNIIARIHTDFPEKFGIPRQSGMADSLKGIVELLPPYSSPEAVRGLEGFSHIWLIWQFSANAESSWSPTVRPPRLGGNRRVGVFATRSPFRPNPIGMSCVKLDKIAIDGGTVRLHVRGADLMDGTPIYDIKPYVPHADCKPEAVGGFSDEFADYRLAVDFPEGLLAAVPIDKRDALRGVLAQDPRPSYQDDPTRVYGMSFAGMGISFTVDGGTLHVVGVK